MFDSMEQKGKIFTNIVTKRPVDVILQTPHNLIQGKIHVRINQRLKDELDDSCSFLAITDATILNLDGKTLYQSQFIAVNRSHIVWLFPQGELTQEQNRT